MARVSGLGDILVSDKPTMTLRWESIGGRLAAADKESQQLGNQRPVLPNSNATPLPGRDGRVSLDPATLDRAVGLENVPWTAIPFSG